MIRIHPDFPQRSGIANENFGCMNSLGARTRITLRRIALAAVVIISAAVIAPRTMAQTLTKSNATTKASPPSGRKPRATADQEFCSVFGHGFIRVPGTDACVRIGAGVTVEGGNR